jgi:hypothetical protein
MKFPPFTAYRFLVRKRNFLDTIIIVDTMNLDKGQNLSIGANVQFTFDGNVAHVFSKDGLNLEMK